MVGRRNGIGGVEKKRRWSFGRGRGLIDGLMDGSGALAVVFCGRLRRLIGLRLAVGSVF